VPSAAQLEKNGLPRKPSEKSVFLNVPSVSEMIAVYRYLKSEMATILKASRARSIFDGARAFRDIYFYFAAGLRAGRRV
jgi:hypothetical protein